MKKTIIYDQLQESKTKITALQRGIMSGKTINTLIWFIHAKLLLEENKTLMIARPRNKHLRFIKNDVKFVLEGLNIKYEETMQEITVGTNKIKFITADNLENVRERMNDYLFFNGADEFDAIPGITGEQIFLLLSFRTVEKIVLDFNTPHDPLHWIYSLMENRNSVTTYISTYRDNPFIRENYLQNFKDLGV